MLFNSFEFALFLPLVFLAYWLYFAKAEQRRHWFLIAVSYLFYGWWDWRFLSLIVFSSLIDYIAALQIGKADTAKRKKLFLTLSLLTNLGFLGVFKYYNFFAASFTDLLRFFGMHADPFTLNILLPVGISFYTFQTMSYTIDVYRGHMAPVKNLPAFFAYVAFFPQLVAGPIERATQLLPQFFGKKAFNYADSVYGLRLMLWGFFKKIVIADNCAQSVNYIFDNYTTVSSVELMAGAFLFALQIYGDFSGYSDIAIGSAKMFGFDLMTNFKTPYFARDMAEFWRRWHISLTTWFRDYLYIPLGGSRGGTAMKVRNTFIIFLVSGFWHGANWTFIVWGLLNALYFLPLLLGNANRKNLNTVAEGRLLPSLREAFQMTTTMVLACIAWVFFRSPDIGAALGYFKKMASSHLLPHNFIAFSHHLPLVVLLFLLLEWLMRASNFSALTDKISNKVFRHAFYYMLVFVIILFGAFNRSEFIYFQF